MKRIAFYGVGTTGSAHIKAFQSTELFHITCLASRSLSNASKKAHEIGVPAAANIDEIFEKYYPDIILICVPPNVVSKILLEALKYPWEILVEKPAGLNLQESNHLSDCITKNERNNKVWVGMNRRMLPSTLKSREILNIAHNTEREKIEVNIVDQQDTETAQRDGHKNEVIKHWHFANSIHLIDLGLSFFEQYPSLESVTKYPFGRGYVLNANFKNSFGDQLNYKAYWNLPAPWLLQITSQSGWLQQSPLENQRFQFPKINSASLNSFEYNEPKDLKPGFFNQAKALSGEHPKLRKLMCTFEQSHATMQIIEQIYEQ